MKAVVYSVVLVAVFACCRAGSTTGSTADPLTVTTDAAGSPSTTIVSTIVSHASTHESTATTDKIESTTGTDSGKLTSSATSPYFNGSSAEPTVTSSSWTQHSESETGTISFTVTTLPSAPTTTACTPRSGFDAASFIGGIILALGLIVILGIVVKCYQHHVSKSELQYSQF